MNIIGPDYLLFGVDDVEACCTYLRDYGLAEVPTDEHGRRFEAQDGTGIVICHKDEANLPPAMPTATQLRETVYGVADQAALDAILAELSRDREVSRSGDGALHTVDDMGFAIGFQLTRRRAISAPPALANTPGAPQQRSVNHVAVNPQAQVVPLTLSHVVYFVPDAEKAERFYVDRLGFRATDRFTGVGPFLRPAGTQDHHTLFLIQTPPFMKGIDHFTFHVASGTDVLQAGARFEEKGYKTFWGPGRHLFGSNWFWYFNSPLGCKVEYDADMDLHDDNWVARESPMGADNSQLFLFTRREKWAPGGAPH
ncbi:MAG: VOC family protein [Pseudomonadota bacterium]